MSDDQALVDQIREGLAEDEEATLAFLRQHAAEDPDSLPMLQSALDKAIEPVPFHQQPAYVEAYEQMTANLDAADRDVFGGFLRASDGDLNAAAASFNQWAAYDRAPADDDYEQPAPADTGDPQNLDDALSQTVGLMNGGAGARVDEPVVGPETEYVTARQGTPKNIDEGLTQTAELMRAAAVDRGEDPDASAYGDDRPVAPGSLDEGIADMVDEIAYERDMAQ